MTAITEHQPWPTMRGEVHEAPEDDGPWYPGVFNRKVHQRADGYPYRKFQFGGVEYRFSRCGVLVKPRPLHRESFRDADKCADCR